jgi:cation:H+ antiporter
MTASVPEFVSSINGLFAGDTGVIFGTILGSNLTGITLVAGVFALVGRKIKLKNKVLKNMEVALFFMIALPFVLGADGTLSRIDAGVMILVYGAYVVRAWLKEKETGHMRRNVGVKFLWKDGLIFLLALAALFLSSRFLVNSSIVMAGIFDVPTYLMAILVLGIASSLPDMLVGIRAILGGDVGVGLGSALGSLVVKSLLFLGIFALIKPLPVDFNLIGISILGTVFALAIIMFLSERGEMNWKNGLVLLFIYIAYIAIELVRSFT